MLTKAQRRMTRSQDRFWSGALVQGLDAVVDFPGPGLSIKLVDIYSDLDFPFALEIPNAETRAALAEDLSGAECFESVEEMFRSILASHGEPRANR